MPLTIPTQPFLAALQAVNAVVPSRTPKDVLKSVLVSVDGNGLSLTASDSEVSIRHRVDGVDADGFDAFLLLPGRLISILREANTETFTADRDGNTITLKAGRSKFKLQVADAAEFPQFPDFDGDVIEVKGAELSTALEKTAFAADPASERYALGGVLFEPGHLVATDSHRLAAIECNTVDEGKHVVPLKAVRLLSGLSGSIDIGFTNNAMHATCGSIEIHSRLVEGRFPSWRDAIPRDGKTQIEFVAGPLLSAVRQSMIVTNEESRGVDFAFTSGLLRLTSAGKDVGESDIELPISYDGDPITITLEPKYVAEFLRTLDASAAVTLRLIAPDAAAVFTSGGGYQYVVMPMARQG